MICATRFLTTAAVCLVLSAGPPLAETGPEASRHLALLESGTPAERTAAARWLGLHLVAEAGEPLNRQLQQLFSAPPDPAYAEFVRTALMMRTLVTRPETLEFHDLDEVLAHLDDPAVHLRASAVRHLAYYAPPDAVSRTVPFLDDSEAFVREEAIATLQHLGDRRHTERVLDLLEDPGAAVRLRALEYLLDVDRPALLPRLVTVAADPSPWIAQPAVRALQQGGRGPAAVGAILDNLGREASPDVVAGYLAALERFEDREAWPKRWPERLRPLLTHPDAAVRRGAAVLLGDRDKAAARDVLVGLLDSADPAERAEAARALIKGEWTLDARAIERLLDDDAAPVRLAALDLAQDLPAPRRRALLLAVIGRSDEEDDVLARALAGLAEVGAADDVATLVARIGTLASEHVLINATLTMAALEQRWQTRAARDWFRARLADPEAGRALRQAIVHGLRVAGDPSFLAPLADELRATPVDDTQYAAALIETISVLVGRRVHGPDFAASETP